MTTVEVPALNPVRCGTKASLPKPAVEAHLIMEGRAVWTTSVARLQVDETGGSVPPQHEIEFSGRPAFRMEEALRLTDSRVFDPRPNGFPRLGVVGLIARLLPTCETGNRSFIEVRRPSVR